MSMSKEQYREYLKRRGYILLNENRVALGSLVFNIVEAVNRTAMGSQEGFCLKLSPESDTNLCPDPWHQRRSGYVYRI